MRRSTKCRVKYRKPRERKVASIGFRKVFWPQATKKVYAFFAALTPFLTTSLLAFLDTKVLNLSKSLSDFRFSMAALLVAHDDLFHFSTTPSVDSCFRTVPEPALRGSFGRRNGVRVRCRYGKAWRGTPVWGPSTMAYSNFRKRPRLNVGLPRTLLWSIISAITAVLPAWGPDRRRTTGKSGTMVNHVF